MIIGARLFRNFNFCGFIAHHNCPDFLLWPNRFSKLIEIKVIFRSGRMELSGVEEL